jgi:hypothetical protein
MALTTQSANDLLNYMLRNVAPSWGGVNTLYLSLHTGSIGGAGDQTTNEVSYTGYARVAVTRTSSGTFAAASSGASENSQLIIWGNATGGSFPINATYAAIGEAASGAGTVLQYTPLASTLVINTNIQPKLDIGELDFNAV